MPPPRENAYNLVVCPPKVTKLKLQTRTNAENLVKNTANKLPLRHKFIAKIGNFDSFGGCIPTQGVYNYGKPGKPGNLREFIISGKLRENSGNLKSTQGNFLYHMPFFS